MVCSKATGLVKGEEPDVFMAYSCATPCHVPDLEKFTISALDSRGDAKPCFCEAHKLARGNVEHWLSRLSVSSYGRDGLTAVPSPHGTWLRQGSLPDAYPLQCPKLHHGRVGDT